MALTFLDTSALGRVLLGAQSAPQVAPFLHTAQHPTVSRLTTVELRSAVYKADRTGQLSVARASLLASATVLLRQVRISE